MHPWIFLEFEMLKLERKEKVRKAIRLQFAAWYWKPSNDQLEEAIDQDRQLTHQWKSKSNQTG